MPGEPMTENASAQEASYFLGFDGGGTKTECVLAGADGCVVARATAGPSNPVRAGYARAWFSLSEAADILLSRQKITSNDIRGICAGIGGAGRASTVRRLSSFFERSFPNAEVEVTTDLEIALDAAFGSGEGIILIAGTGSSVIGRDSTGRREHAGGKGPWFSDEGSAYDIGRRAVAAVLLAEENRGPSTALSGRLFPHLQTHDWNGVLDQVSKSPDAVFPQVFPLVAELAESGDAVSRQILSDAARSLAALVASVAQKLGWQDEPAPASAAQKSVPVARVGGMHGRSKFLDAALDAELTKAAPRWKPIALSMSPAEAAVRMAARAKGNAAPIR
ncbi:MAG TPA: BadF/BadG/BcrA/BcrD ATPase family protein [Candidatus Acidoferrales bacterium]|nr:BadF/BadG/BcrA/BcrD ATPase family protein [Candidatus Acidoferrales bacterium]